MEEEEEEYIEVEGGRGISKHMEAKKYWAFKYYQFQFISEDQYMFSAYILKVGLAGCFPNYVQVLLKSLVKT